ncbi:MAG TPA: 50S ribosomal protein L4 [Candidatus Paceibacterota bacterium]|nr:50S ribosomal protein L4 [Candidatus Paceibacterota bacterium]
MATKSKTTKKEANAANLSADVFNAQGKKVGSLALPENLFGVQWNESLMHQVVTSMQDNARTPVAHTKGRGEVRGGGKKPWRQKGTGRARHGSIRSPIWRGGGVTHGPRNEKVFARAIPRKMRAKALFMALSRKLRDGEVVFVDTFGLEKPSTASAKKALVALAKSGFEKLNTPRKNVALVAFSDAKEASTKSFRNLGNVSYASVRDLNPVAVLKHAYLIVENPEAAVAILSHRASKK